MMSSLSLLLTLACFLQTSGLHQKKSYPYYRHLFPEYYSKKTVPTNTVHDQNPGKPHILFILADDLGWNDVSWNNPDVITPNLQSLASNGVILNQSYAQAVCSPSRAAYLTGMYPYRIGFQGAVVRNGAAQFLPLNLTLLPEKLKEKGYSTHLVGKWHLGNCRVDATPTLRGFDSFFGCYSGAIDYFTKILPHYPVPNLNITEPEAYDLRQNLDVFPSPPTDYVTDIFTDRAEKIIKEHDKSTPMYLSLHYTAPHYPLKVPDSYLDFYPNVTDPDRRTFLAIVTAMDEGIGKVIHALKSRNMYDNTIIVFTSDNGAVAGKGGGSNFPLRGQKGTYYEGGVRSPTFVHSPKFLFNSGGVSEEIFHIVDWYPTLLEAAGQNNAGGGLDGKSQWSMLTEGTEGRRTGFVYEICDQFGGVYALRRKKYKLIEGNAQTFVGIPNHTAVNCTVPPPCDCQLFDLEADPTESNDLVCEKPAVVRSMYRRLTKLKADQVPSLLADVTVVPASLPEFNNGTVSYGWC